MPLCGGFRFGPGPLGEPGNGANADHAVAGVFASEQGPGDRPRQHACLFVRSVFVDQASRRVCQGLITTVANRREKSAGRNGRRYWSRTGRGGRLYLDREIDVRRLTVRQVKPGERITDRKCRQMQVVQIGTKQIVQPPLQYTGARVSGDADHYGKQVREDQQTGPGAYFARPLERRRIACHTRGSWVARPIMRKKKPDLKRGPARANSIRKA